jgi:hypothetical protein
MARSTLRARVALLVLSVLVGESEGCDRPDVGRVLEQVGVADAPPPAPERIDYVCDLSRGSPCNDEMTRRELAAVVAYLWPRMGSRLVVWGVEEDVSDTLPLTTVDVPARAPKPERAERDARSRFLDSILQAVCPVIATRALRGRARHSPLLESVARIAGENARGLRRRLVILSDAHEVTPIFGNWECRNPPTVPELVRELDRHRLLPPGALEGARVHFVRTTPDVSVTRHCPITIAKEERIRDLWRAALRRAGAAEVSFDLGGFEIAPANASRP